MLPPGAGGGGGAGQHGWLRQWEHPLSGAKPEKPVSSLNLLHQKVPSWGASQPGVPDQAPSSSRLHQADTQFGVGRRQGPPQSRRPPGQTRPPASRPAPGSQPLLCRGVTGRSSLKFQGQGKRWLHPWPHGDSWEWTAQHRLWVAGREQRAAPRGHCSRLSSSDLGGRAAALTGPS